MKNPIGWFEIYVDDLSRAKQFYESVFNIQLTELTPPADDNSLQMWAFPLRHASLWRFRCTGENARPIRRRKQYLNLFFM